MNTKGVSALFLIIAMLLMVTIGYVFSYLIPTKHKSIVFPVHSHQAFFAAQSGVEYAVRYGSDQGWRSATDLLRLNNPGINQRNLITGRFTIDYDDGSNTLTSTGEFIGGNERRVVRVSNFTNFLRLIFRPDRPPPCWYQGTRRAQFYIRNVGSTAVTLTAFSASWTQTGPVRRITTIYFGTTQVYSGTYYSGDPPANFNMGGGSHTIGSNNNRRVRIYWNANIANGANFIVTFYTATGKEYIFNLDPDGDGLPAC